MYFLRMRVLSFVVVLLQLLLRLPSSVVQAYSSGAGSCPRGKAAVGESHLKGPAEIVQGTLEEGSFQVTANDIVLTAASSSSMASLFDTTKNSTNTTTTTTSRDDITFTELQIDTTYELTVLGTRYAYKGCLIRLESLDAQDLYAALLPSSNMGPALACVFGDDSAAATNTNPTVTGLTHTDRRLKQIHSGVLRMSDPGVVVLDITIVGMNNASASIYAFSSYPIQFVVPRKDTTATNTTTVAETRTVAPTSPTIIENTESDNITTTTTTSPSATPVTANPTVSPTNSSSSSSLTPTTAAPSSSPVATAAPSGTTLNASSDSVNSSAAPVSAPPVTTEQNVPTVLPPGTFEVKSTVQSFRVQRSLLEFEPVTVALTASEIRKWEDLTLVWFDEFYNGGFPDEDDEVDINNTTTTRWRKLQQKKVPSAQDNYGVVPGSMVCIVSRTNSSIVEGASDSSGDNNAATTTMAILYDQQLDYRTVDKSKPLGHLQYATLPFRSRTARAVYVDRLTAAFATMENVTEDTLPIPKLLGPPESVDSNSSDKDGGWSRTAIISVSVGAGLLAAVLLAAGMLVWSQQDTGHHDNVASLAPDFDRGTFSFGGADIETAATHKNVSQQRYVRMSSYVDVLII